MRKKYIFFDIDGTLTNANPGGIVLESTKRTLKKLKENGHFVAIATGRAHHFAIDFAKENEIENMVCDGGNGLTIHYELISLEPLDFDICNEIIDECREKGIAYCVAIDNTPVLYTNSPVKYNNNMNFDLVEDESLDFHKVDQILKIFISCTPEEEENIISMHKLGYMRYFQTGCIVEPMDKYKGIIKMVEYLNGNIEDIVVFGDGKNDLSMIKQAPISIAMGNAVDEVKDIATFVTHTNVEDGIEFACRHFGWID